MIIVKNMNVCNHVACASGTHFCHVCGFEGEEGAVFEHMSMTYGGINDVDEGEDDHGYDSEDRETLETTLTANHDSSAHPCNKDPP